MTNQEKSIIVNSVTKIYPLYKSHRDRLKEALHPFRKKYHHDFYALNEVSFEVGKGETVGIIGRNGSGKSTLLSIISGVLQPAQGTVFIQGKIGSLLELGAGFNPELTGFENIKFSLAVQGYSSEFIDSKIEQIIQFADIGEFIEQPVKLYSSGMYVRLAFAVQALSDPDILIVDEALAVGDAKFQAKCFERLRQLKEKGTTILLVTHSTEQIVTHCSRAILLEAGQVVESGEPRHVVNRFMDILFGKEKRVGLETQKKTEVLDQGDPTNQNFPLSKEEDVFNTRIGYNPHEYRWGDGAANILDYSITVGNEHYPAYVHTGDTAMLRLSIKFLRNIVRPILGVTLKTKEGITVYGVNTETLKVKDFQQEGVMGSVVEVSAGFVFNLAPGDYFISIGVASRDGENIIPHDRRYDAIHVQVKSDSTFFGLANLRMKLNLQDNQNLII
jgi:lipopolysaccharide transport system ATP-binding protein